MADVRRWKVTYTKHLKQKRKIYHDGFLVLHSSINKLIGLQVMLYDESETLLECRILKGEEAVGSGESLVFNAYLVDIGDPEGVLKASNGSKGSWMRRKEFKSPVSVGNQAGGAEINNAQKISLSPSQKLIREFKKREIHKYGSPPRNATSVEPSGAGTSSIFVSFTVENRHCSGLYVLEWQVLYTTSLTQKAKKYHDGFLRCQNSGVMSRQVMLFDESSKLLECRFLKKGEEVRSGETMEFQGHLVEIGECKENYKTFTVMDAGGSSCSSSRKLEMPKQKNDTNMGQSVVKVWQVLYTAQVTQKAKKYHDGFLQLATCGSFGRQLMLYDANWKLIDNKFLKKDEMIRSGAPVQFDSHLVDNLDSEWKEETLTDKSEQKTIFGDTSERKKGYGNLGCTRVNNSNGEGWLTLSMSCLFLLLLLFGPL
ncbi:hypothetical protein SAY86_000804 [Trapa natans]|uniref:5'-3' DNA helicase ZGRF1-like N-terminal domain-containing protein n=1 Tax=Trapa natans TaxID=22666 RepID=A0AAN7MFL0_TRANT|nr:hypothetical protein SAY86_000804 [Trapa natans]